jgi:glycosyltransferase involved in cell wall biosynthesis
VSGARDSVRRVAVVCAVAPAPSHTYITDHLNYFKCPAPIHGWEPMVGERPVFRLLERLVFKGRRRLLRERGHVQTTAGYIRAFRQLRAEVVLAEYGDTGVGVMEACRRASLPLVVHFHGRDASRTSVLEQHRATYPRLFDQARGVIAVSRDMTRTLTNLGCPASKLHLIPCGVDPDRFRGASPDTAPPVFIAVGRLIEKKGPLATIAAFREVLSQVPSARLRIIGDGMLRQACETLIRQLRMDHAVSLLGIQPTDVVASEMRGARAFVQHSIRTASGDTEGSPVSVMEASASGLPVVATRHAGIPDLVIDGETGLLVEEGDVRSMARAMIALASQPDLAARLGAAGRRHIAANYSSTHQLAKLDSVLTAACR